MARASLIALAAMTLAGAGGALIWPGAGSPATGAAAATAATLGAHAPRRVLTPDELRRGVAAGLLPPGARSILGVDGPFRYGDFVWDETGAHAGAVRVHIDLRDQLLSVYRGGDEIGTALILYGSDGHATPLGAFPIRAKLRHHRSAQYDAEMPFTLRLTDDGVAIHASDVRWGRATHGCVGVPPAFAARLFAAVHVGDPVLIERARLPAGRG